MLPKKIYVDSQPPLVTGPWTLVQLRSGEIGYPKNGLKVFSCFHCGGGSTMGYKLAGFDVLGGVEIDSEMMDLYRRNHNPDPKFSFQMPIQDFPAMAASSLPQELFDLDILDGSPPCSSFSMAGSREEGWNEKRLFREGQTEQVLDDLFFHFIKVAEMLKPRVVIAENVKGLVIGNAKGYVRDIFRAFRDAGYSTQLFLLNSSRMGVPQARERTFFIARRHDLKMPSIEMSFDEGLISVKSVLEGVSKSKPTLETIQALPLWTKAQRGSSLSKVHPKGSYFNWHKLHPDRPSPTIAANCRIMHWSEPRMLEHNEILRLQTFPEDYDFMDLHSSYVCGMSVPPLMMQRVALQVAKQLLGVGAP